MTILGTSEPTRAPKEPRHVAWGASPRKGGQSESQAPKGRRQTIAPGKLPSPRWGSGDSFGYLPLGLTPQATRRYPFGADSKAR